MPPDGLAFNSTGDLFVTDREGATITEITPGGVQTTFASGLDQPAFLAFQGESLPDECSALGLLAIGVIALVPYIPRSRIAA